MPIPNPLREHRLKKKLTLADASALFGVHKTTFMRWERQRVPAEMVLIVEDRLGIERSTIRPDLYPAKS
jgi:transcriptional regulator with XRE-family HTH domain